MAVIELTTQNFNEEVLQSDVPVMVFKNGEAVATSVGAKSKAELLALLD